MRILWIVNIIFPFPAKQLGLKENNMGGWLNGLANEIKKKKDVEIAIATVYSGKEILEYNDGEILYYLIPGAPALRYNKKLEKYWKVINKKFKPDLVHIHGTEYVHGLAFINANPNVKTITSIQGLVSKIADVYTANLSNKEIMKNITFRDCITNNNIFQQRNKFRKRGKNEEKIIKKTQAIIGRTFWDYSNVKSINNNIKYYKVNEILREEFYTEERWDFENVEKHSIYFSQAGYPVKGFHILLEAINILKSYYPDIKVYIGGKNIIKNKTLQEKLTMIGYGKILRKRIKKYKLENSIDFVGNLNASQVKEYMLRSNVYVLSSVIENESNSLSEAANLGLPCVVSYVGGVVDRIHHNLDGLIYPVYEPAMLAENINKIFKEKEFAKNIGENARKNYNKINNRQKNVDDLYNVYKEIYNS